MNKYQYKVNGIDYEVEINDIQDNIATVSVNGKTFEIEMKNTIHKPIQPKKEVKVEAPKEDSVSAPVAPTTPKTAPTAGNGTKVNAPLPGTITEVKVVVGQTVKTGDTVVVLEAMKMQNNIEAEADGTVTSILVNKGDTVMEGTPLVIIG